MINILEGAVFLDGLPVLEEDQDKFWFSIERDPSTGCWNWTSAKNGEGYGYIRRKIHCDFPFKFPAIMSHRLSYMLLYGDLSEDDLVLHRCDNPSCVNPEHLFKGTQVDNVQDCYNKGRNYHKLVDVDVDKIRKRVASGESIAQVRKDYNLSYNWTWKIIHNKAHKDRNITPSE